ncbi:MAG: ABC transporter permease [Candidatus Solibacter usitatus]|nr:ABC transporter permease [Candidatus Solibacter usitatus]
MVNLLRAERIKLRRSLPLRLAVVGPLATVAVQFFVFLNQRHMDIAFWPVWHNQVEMFWALIALPALIAIQAASLTALEHGNDTWKAIGALPNAGWHIFLVKTLVLYALVGASFLLLVGFSFVAGLVIAGLRQYEQLAGGAVAQFVSQTAAMYVACLLVCSFQMWLSMRYRSFTAPVSIGIFGMAVGLMLVRDDRVGPWFPWLFPVDVVAYGRVHAALGIVAGGAGGLVITLIGCSEFSRRERV